MGAGAHLHSRRVEGAGLLTSRATSRRDDIQGLRAIAVTSVVLFHARVSFLAGGFTGVDVFYVISGFLITGLLWREMEGRGAVGFAGFYARRARRLLPAAILVLVVTMAVAAAVMTPLEVRSVWKDGAYCAVYVCNIRFAARGTNYLAGTTTSPFEHYWSLGVEEQFYLVWPLLLTVACVVWARRRPSRSAGIVVLTIVSAVSLGLSVYLTRTDEPLAFFTLPTRAWELGAGGLLALLSPQLAKIPRAAAALLGWGGLVAMVVAFVTFGSRTAFPGTAALLPVLGAAAVVASGIPGYSGNGPWRVLSTRIGREVGSLSYSWYLWHFPVLVLAPYVLGHAVSVWGDLSLSVVSLGLAWLTYTFIEDPARRGRWVSAHARRGLTAGAVLSAAGLVACLGAAASIPSLRGHGIAPQAVIHAAAARPDASPTKKRSPRATIEAALDSAQSQVEAAVAASAPSKDVPANLKPSLSAASASLPAPMVDGCLLSYTDVSAPPCLFGDTSAQRSIVLFGDSHAAMWFPSVDSYANSHSYRLYVVTKAACPPVQITLFSPVLGRTWTECQDWYSSSLAEITARHPALVVLGIAPDYDSVYDVTQDGPKWLAGLAHTITTLRAAGSRVLLLGAAPSPPASIPDCLSGALDHVPQCDFSPVGKHVPWYGHGLIGIDAAGNRAVQATVTGAGGTYADVDPWFCTTQVCDTIVDNILVYRDNSHVTVPFATYLAPLVADEIRLALVPAAVAPG